MLISAPRIQTSPEISPDGRYVAYGSNEDGSMSVFVSQVPTGQGKWQLPIVDAHSRPRWSVSGDRLYVSDELQRIIEFPVDRTRLFEIGAPLARIQATLLMRGGYDRMPDGAHFLVPLTTAGTQPPARLLVVQNWSAQAR